MRLLFDQNLSPSLKDALQDLYPESAHTRDVGLESATDTAVWEYAKDNGFVIASKDSDYRQLSFMFGHPPKVIWIRRGNCSTKDIEFILRHRHHRLLAFYRDDQDAFFAVH